MTPIAVRAAGMVTAVGLSMDTTCAAMRAGVSGASRANLWDPYSMSWIQASRVPLRQWWEGAGKLVELLAPAVRECLTAALPVSPKRVPILLGVPTLNRPFRWSGFDEWVLDALADKIAVPLHPASTVFARGNASVVVCLRQARRLIEEERAPCCIVAGVDSYLQQNMVQAYNDQERILTPANSNGFIPGEAGSAVLVAPARNGPPPSGQLVILGDGLAWEKAIVGSDKPLRGEGLTDAVKQALDAAQTGLVDMAYRLTDLNGEHYKFKEANYVIGRLLRIRRPDIFDLWHPAEFIGECGAAIGPIMLGWALHAARKGYAPGRTVLCHLSDDDGERAAIAACSQIPGGK